MSRSPRPGESPISPTSRPPPTRHASSGWDAGTKLGSQRPIQHMHRVSTAGSTHSIASALESASPAPIIAESSDNAISSLLQNPIVRTGLVPQNSVASSLRFPTVREIPPVTLTAISPIDESVFKSYLNQAEGLYDVFRRTKEAAEEARRPTAARTPTADDMAGEGLGLGMHRRLSGTPTVTRRETDDVAATEGTRTQHRRKSSGGTSRRNPHAVAPLSTIPPVYFEQDFRLENPRTFDIVSERSEIARPLDGAASPMSPGSSGKKALAANAILQEKLSWYMDTVEIHLISSISTASTSFFAALGSLRGLQEEAAESVSKIQLLRKDLDELDKGMAMGGLEIIAKKRRRENLRRLTDAVEQLEFVTKCISNCEQQVETGEVETALSGLTDVEHLIAGQKPAPRKDAASSASDFTGSIIDLRGVKALEGVNDDINLLRTRIGKVYEYQFVRVLLRDLHRHVDKVPAEHTLERLSRASNNMRGGHHRTSSIVPAFENVDDAFRAELRNQLKGLAKSDSILTAATAYREAILKEFKNLIRTHLPTSSDDDVESTTSIATHESRVRSSQEKSSILARNLRALEQDEAVEMFKKIYTNVAEGLRRLKKQVTVLLDITSSLENPSVMRSPQFSHAFSPQLGASMRSPPWGSPGERSRSFDGRMSALKSPGTPPIAIRHEEFQQTLDLSSLLGQAVDIAQAQVTKVLKVRVEQTTRMDFPQFLQYFALNRLFADECEAVSGRQGSALKTVVNEHIKTFINVVADTERTKLVQKMDADKWDARDFSDAHSARVQRIKQAMASDVEEWANLGSLFNDPATPKASTNGLMEEKPAETAPTSSKDKVRPAVINEERYILPESAMIVLEGIENYERLITGIRSMSAEICSSMLDYLKLFNSRSSQLILGAGATKSAGLKNITTKHLALSSQGLSFVVALIPYVREFARRGLPVSSALPAEFDRVKRLLQEHQSGIHDKLVEIMTGRATAHANSMRKIDWDAEKPSTNVNQYMETLMKETATLHKVLTRHLPDSSVAMIMQPVLAGYQDQWTRAFNSAEVKTAAGKERLVRDADYFRTRISRIEGASDIGESIYKLAQEKPIREEAKPAEANSTEGNATATEAKKEAL